ncbi:MAG: S41 family peptidase [Pirellulaceae bacterium]|nr:S41 family peptidase [Pirellulaceae bacterium]
MKKTSFWFLLALLTCISPPPLTLADDAPQPAKTPEQLKADKEFELLKLFADALDQVERNYVKEVDRGVLMEGAIKGMLAKLDPHSSYIGPSDLEKFKSSVENEFGGIGITVSTESGELVVTTPLYGTPAYHAGIRGGDKITEIDGQPTKGITMDEAIKRIKGKLGTNVKLSVLHLADGSTDSKEVTRELIRVDSVIGNHRKSDDTWNFFLDEQKKIGYIRITTFSRHTADEIRSALQQLSAGSVKGLVLDLRWNPGGLLTAAIEISDFFVAEGRIVSTSGRGATERKWEAKKEGTFDGFPIAVLVNHSSASASEILAACLQDHKKGVVIGERTWGKGSVQNIIELDDGKSAMKLTTAGYKRPSGQNIHREEGAKETDEWGVKPNEGFELKLTDAEVEEYFVDRKARDVIAAKPKEPTAETARKLDKQVQKAVDYLGTELAKSEG